MSFESVLMDLRGIVLGSAFCASAAGCGKHDSVAAQKDAGRIAMGDLVLSPSSADQSRRALLPTMPTEDARHILGEIALPHPPVDSEERDYLPEPAVEWIVDVRFKGNPPLNPQAVSDAFDQSFRETFGDFSAFGRDVETDRWTFLISADGPKSVDQLKFAFHLIDQRDEDAPLADEGKYVQRIEEITKRMLRFGDATVSASLAPSAAVERSRHLRKLKTDSDKNAVLILRAERGSRYDGKKVWDVMLCLGLEWGDMDCFHWQNRSAFGGDYLFSVETTTAPGYFLPERIAAGKVHVDDLVFVFSIPRCPQPVEVFDAMARAVEYGRARLGGSVHCGNNSNGDVNRLRQEIQNLVEQLRAAGFEPGAHDTLRLF